MNNTRVPPLPTIDGETLMSKPLQPLNFVVDTLISQGLHILARSPKVGKSWLALWLAVTVAKGEPVWSLPVKQGTTLYLCLEDSQLRIQNRLFEITEDAPSNAHFCTDSGTLGQGLEEQLELFLSEHPDTVLVIIDTLQMIRGSGYDNTYANDYRDLSVLKKIADTHSIAILLIHHLRKEKADDVFSRISGTTAISGAVDSSFTLVEERRGSGRARLSCIGRDIEYRELELQRDDENVWELVSGSDDQTRLPGFQIVPLLCELLDPCSEFIGTPTELSKRIDPDTDRKIKAAMPLANSRSQNEFVEAALRFYCDYLMAGDCTTVLPPMYLSALRGTVQDTENRICRLLFKQSVELDMVMNVLAAGMEISEGALDDLRSRCVYNVKRTNGSVSLKEAVRYQAGADE